MKNVFSRQNNIFFIFLSFAALEVFAHHGWSYYQDEISMDLIVLELRLRNPHDRIIAIDKSNQEWNLLLAPPARNRRFGFDGSIIEVADEIVILGQKHINKNELKIHCIYKNENLIYTYRYPNGQTSHDFMRLQGSC
ncbi:MAG: hypothetical protein ACI8XI_000827 [Woeseiaceae bacterium]|jgi:hypothetical protein|nr:hypothetical protein [Woeseiaceae bacterium]|tara:strand:- start:238 stop:648 length:411 start_codon:yes stop_codon:yes gene_type:complete